MQYFNCQQNDLIKILNPNSESVMKYSIWRVLGEGWEEDEEIPYLIIQGHDIDGNWNEERDWYCDDDDYEIVND